MTKKFRITHFFLLSLVLFVVGFGVHTFLFAQTDPGSLVSLNESNGAVDNSTEREILSLLLELKSITLDTGVFESKAFNALKDFGVTLEPEPVRRVNPFAPIGVDEVTTAGESSSVEDQEKSGAEPSL